MKLFFDGVEVASTITTDRPRGALTPNSRVSMGALVGDNVFGADSWQNFDGLIDNVRLSDVALDVADFLNCKAEDADGDGISDTSDNCPAIANPAQENNDEDGLGDVCDPDDDNDGVVDEEDNCPIIANSLRDDFDLDGLGNVCDLTFDASETVSDIETLVLETRDDILSIDLPRWQWNDLKAYWQGRHPRKGWKCSRCIRARLD